MEARFAREVRDSMRLTGSSTGHSKTVSRISNISIIINVRTVTRLEEDNSTYLLLY